MRNPTYTDRDASIPPRGGASRRFSLSSMRTLLFVIVAGGLTGLQIFKPNKRVLEATAGFILMMILANVSGFAALFFFIVIYPFPFALAIGSSNLVFSVIIFIISLIRGRSGLFKLYAPTALNVPIALMVISFILSFYNVDIRSPTFALTLVKTGTFISAILFFYLCTSYIDSGERTQAVLKAVLVSAALVIAFTVFELLYPGRIIIPNWLYTRHALKLVEKGYRMSGPFQDFELSAEFFALNMPLMLLAFVRAKSLSSKILYTLLLVADLSMLFSTITRGAFITLVIGLAYLAFLSRRDLNFVKLTITTTALVFSFVLIDTFMARYTASGSLFERLFATTFKSGFIPENRYQTWTHGMTQGLEHPFLGHGAGWDFSYSGQVARWSPHNVYLFLFNTTGLAGLVAFLFFLYRIVRMSTLSLRASLVSSPFPQALLKVLHVILVMFIIDQIKIEYLRNNIYIFFVWLLFGLTGATHHVVMKSERERLTSVPSP